eukprot:6187344-Pleurochrysis_carterae.AAC.2
MAVVSCLITRPAQSDLTPRNRAISTVAKPDGIQKLSTISIDSTDTTITFAHNAAHDASFSLARRTSPFLHLASSKQTSSSFSLPRSPQRAATRSNAQQRAAARSNAQQRAWHPPVPS